MEPEPEQENFASGVPSRRGIRKSGAIVSSVSEGDIRGPYQRALLEKTEAETDIIMRAFAEKPLFAKLDREQLAEVAGVMQVEMFEPGAALMSEGENGDTFFVLAEGSASVTMGKTFVRDLVRGESFGDIALIYNQLRTATITAKTTCTAFTLSREAYRNEVVESIKRQRRAWEQFLVEVPLFSTFQPSQRGKIADALTPIRYETGERIIQQGDVGDKFYILESGAVTITEDNSDKRLEFGRGKFFGEISLIHDVPRTAHVTADSAVRCLTLDRAAFGRLFGQQVVDQLAGTNEIVLPTAAAHVRQRRSSLDGARLPTFVKASLEDFKLGTYVGFGAFGYVRIAKHTPSGKICAIKAMAKGYLVSKHQVRHAVGERDLLLSCEHPGIVQFYGSFQDPSMIYICLEFLNGGELFTLLGLKQRLSNDAARALASEIVLVFDYLHDRSIIYRDLKPENVMLDAAGHVRLIDFGLAKRCPDRTWTMCGTPEYLAPEVVTNQGHNKSADFWTLGVLIYEMLVGVPPFYDETATDDETFNRILKDRPHFHPFVGVAAKDIILNLMEPDITRRLGLMADGCDGVRNHAWFKGLDWDVAMEWTQEMPFVPTLDSQDDLRHFEIEEADILARKKLFETVVLQPSDAKLFETF